MTSKPQVVLPILPPTAAPPAAVVDLRAFDANLQILLTPLRAAGKRVRIATKSLRCPALIGRAATAAGCVDGLMTFTARETLLWAERGAELIGPAAADLLLGYPPGSAEDAALLARANQHAVAGVMVDDARHLDWLSAAAVRHQVTMPVWLDLDMGWRPTASSHIGVRRSPLRGWSEIEPLVERLRSLPGLRLAGLMGYEAHVAGLPDHGRTAAWQNPLKRWIKRASWNDLVSRRADVVARLRAFAPDLRCNGGGSGSVVQTAGDGAVTEVTIGSGLLCGHLFDGYDGLPLQPALWFALPVSRLPAPGLVTCAGGGWIGSGGIGPDRLPLPVFPAGAALLGVEGAGEVQTPLRLPAGVTLQVGDPVWFRPAKSGELGEVFSRYHTYAPQGGWAEVATYRGLGWSAWG